MPDKPTQLIGQSGPFLDAVERACAAAARSRPGGVVGGRGTILGPIIGALIYVVLLEVLRAFGPLRLLVFALLLTGSVIFLPNGLVSLWRLRPWARSAAPARPEARTAE